MPSDLTAPVTVRKDAPSSSSSNYVIPLAALPTTHHDYSIAASATNKSFLWRNWSKNQQCEPSNYHEPRSVDDVIHIIKYAKLNKQHVKAVGNGHSPADCALTDEHMMTLKHMNKLLSVDVSNKTVTVQSGMQLTDFNLILRSYQWALPTLGSVSDQTWGGTLGAGTHGTGNDCMILSAYVTALDLIDGTGTLYHCSAHANADLFNAARVNLGCLGVVTQVTVKCVDSYDLREHSELVPLDVALDDFDRFTKDADLVRMHWFPHTDKMVVTTMKKQSLANDRLPSASRSTTILSKITSFLRRAYDAANSAYQNVMTFHLYQFLLAVSIIVPSIVPYLNRFYQWFIYAGGVDRTDEYDRILNFDCLLVNTLQSGRCRAAKLQTRCALFVRSLTLSTSMRISQWRFVGAPLITFGCQQRTVADSVWIGIISYRPYGIDRPRHEYFEQYEQTMLHFDGRPHWAKQWSLPAETVERMYSKWNAFKAVRAAHDPDNIFVNDYIKRIFPETYKTV